MSDAPTSSPTPWSSKGPDPLIGRVVNGRYRITSLIARGGMGKVYRAEQAPLGREVALKVLSPHYKGDNDPEFHKRFFLEASVCAKLTHPNTVTVFDYGRTDDDVYYIAMELLEGRTLHRALRDETVLPPQRALHIARQVCRSLREAHGMGVIHRDLKPANIYLVRHGDEYDFAKVLDFGLVKNIGEGAEELTQTGLFLGSPKYMSPEQIRGEKVDGRCDIYALGVIMFEMLTGKVPFDRPNSAHILMAHVHEAVPAMTSLNPEIQIEPALEEVVMKAMAKIPEDRYASMDAFLMALKQASVTAGFGSAHACPDRPAGRLTSAARTSKYSSIPSARACGRAHPANLSEPAAGLSDHACGSAQSGAMTAGGEFSDRVGAYPVGATEEPVFVGVLSPSVDSLITSSHTRTAARKSPPEPMGKHDGKTRNKLVTAAVLLTMGTGSALALYDDAPAGRPPAAVATAPETAPPTAPTAAVSEEAPRRIRILLRSTPPGASVVIGDRRYGPTPAEIEWTGEDARIGREVKFQFQLEGHRDHTITRTLYGDALSVEATLERVELDLR